MCLISLLAGVLDMHQGCLQAVMHCAVLQHAANEVAMQCLLQAQVLNHMCHLLRSEGVWQHKHLCNVTRLDLSQDAC